MKYLLIETSVNEKLMYTWEGKIYKPIDNRHYCKIIMSEFIQRYKNKYLISPSIGEEIKIDETIINYFNNKRYRFYIATEISNVFANEILEGYDEFLMFD